MDGMGSAGVGDFPLRMAMIGGGTGAFIGPVHRRAAALDGQIILQTAINVIRGDQNAY